MTTINAKNIALALLLTSNVATASFVGYHWSTLYPPPTPSKNIKKKITAPEIVRDPARKGRVREAVMARTGEIEACYDRYLSTRPSLKSGSVEVSWRIESDGRVSGAHVSATELKDESLETCIVSRVNEWSFTDRAGDSPVQVAHRFIFKDRTPASMDFR